MKVERNIVLIFLGVFVLAIFVVLFSSGVLFSPQANADVNNDGEVNIFDLVMVRNCLGMNAMGNCESKDVNGDGAIDIFDLVLIRNYLGYSLVNCTETSTGITEIWSKYGNITTYTSNDYCLDNETLMDWSCVNGQPDVKEVSCGQGNICYGGECVSLKSSQSYLLRAKVFHDITDDRNETTIEKKTDIGWDEVCVDRTNY